MRSNRREFMTGASGICVGLMSAVSHAAANETISLPKAYIDGMGEGWKPMLEAL